MVSLVESVTVLGVEAIQVGVEGEIVSSLRRFSIVGLPDGIVKEAKDRVKCAIENSGFQFPTGEVIVSLSPAALPKMGSGFDVAIALSILAAQGILTSEDLYGYIFVGELALDGRIKAVGTEVATLSLVNDLEEVTLVCSSEASGILGFFPEINSKVVSTLSELVSSLRSGNFHREIKRPIIDKEEKEDVLDPFLDVVGHEVAKRALIVAAAGGHNILMVGPPGSGKTMLAERLSKILPSLERDELMEVNKIYGMLRNTGIASAKEMGLVWDRPFRSPHHSTSVAGLIGGGSNPIPGEVTLAHRGVLFLDEFPEIRRDALECLREPLENRSISITRAKFRLKYPSDFILVAAMNPCPCGKRGASDERRKEKVRFNKRCECSDQLVKKYAGRISAPILDRIDVQLWIPVVPPSSIHGAELEMFKLKGEGPVDIVKRVRKMQFERFKSHRKLNASMKSADLKLFCEMSKEARELLENATEKYGLSTRAYTRMLKLARTIGDIEEAEQIELTHIAEAISYRVDMLSHVS
jgi:magnesium chelatase family protein